MDSFSDSYIKEAHKKKEKEYNVFVIYDVYCP